MIYFKLYDENTPDSEGYSTEHSFELNLDSTDKFYDEIMEKPEFEEFLDNMESGNNDYNGVHDFMGDEDSVGYSSYEITDFPLALSKWKEFFNEMGLIS